jgi:hypothetical protein
MVKRRTHTADPLVPEPSPFEIEIFIVKFGNYKLPCWQN